MTALHPAGPAQELVARLACPLCRAPVIVEATAVTVDEHVRSGLVRCDRCGGSVASVERSRFRWFDHVGPVEVNPHEPTRVPVQHELRLPAHDPRLAYAGFWIDAGRWRTAEGRANELVSASHLCTGVQVRLVRHPFGGIVEFLLDGDSVGRADLFQEAGSVVECFPIADDLPAGIHTATVRAVGECDPAASGAQLIVEEFVFTAPAGTPGFAAPAPINLGNPYSAKILQRIDEAGPGAWVLECGGGDRRRCNPRHVNFEYLNFEFADMTGDIHRLPFADDAFDLTFTQAVFEHVAQPFEAARELIRVTRPGGLIVTEVAFMQPLHAVPYHYFNMTAWGVEELFSGCEIVERDWFGELSATVEWLMRSAGLDASAGDGQIREIIDRLRGLDPLITHDQLQSVASGVYLVARKPG